MLLIVSARFFSSSSLPLCSIHKGENDEGKELPFFINKYLNSIEKNTNSSECCYVIISSNESQSFEQESLSFNLDSIRYTIQQLFRKFFVLFLSLISSVNAQRLIENEQLSGKENASVRIYQ